MSILREFPKKEFLGKRKIAKYYNDSVTSHERRKEEAERTAQGCWWIETFLKMYPNIIKK